MSEDYNADWIGDGLQYQDPPGTFEGIEDLEIMEIYNRKLLCKQIPFMNEKRKIEWKYEMDKGK